MQFLPRFGLATGNVILPVLSLLQTPWIGYYIPGNLVEKIIVNAFFPGGAGAIAGEIFFSSAKGETLEGKEKYVARLKGALLQTDCLDSLSAIRWSAKYCRILGRQSFRVPNCLSA